MWAFSSPQRVCPTRPPEGLRRHWIIHRTNRRGVSQREKHYDARASSTGRNLDAGNQLLHEQNRYDQLIIAATTPDDVDTVDITNLTAPAVSFPATTGRFVNISLPILY